MIVILTILGAGFLVLLVFAFWLLRRKLAWLAVVIAIAVTVSGALLLSLTGAISVPIVIQIPDGVDESKARAIVDLVLRREYLSVLYGDGFRDQWLDNIKVQSISGTNSLIELVVIDPFNWKSEINRQRRLADLVRSRIADLMIKEAPSRGE